ncbi:2-hydroxyacid dehydrogenase [Pelosinus sp. IPA-1]|uniref:2-hydroxyacid dehydrogenase n=1 Tax=Pelosinus sp. IPA-1 TaxID=3029569 RepID=UPI00243619BE|nr:2-hydroxyacid dehydrogenase [Pelosinus sp. IPA-1]GMA97657.1 dehydrogenase [Pelosinus sp. IPA-1]
MEVIALTGQYDPEIKALIAGMVPQGFILKEISSVDEYDNLREVNYIILRILSLNEKTINSIPNLKLIQRWGVGYDKVDVKAAGKRNIPVAITPGMNAAAVSEMAVLLMLAVYRNLIRLHNNVLDGKWQEDAGASSAYTIDGKTVGLIGLGNIGKEVAQKVKAFGAEVQYYDAFKQSPEEEEKLGIKYVVLEELLKTSDIVSLHVPLLDSTRHLICKENLALMKPSAIIVNTARGPIIDEADLVEALENRKILGAGLDCLENEPAAKNNPLFNLSNVVLAPHMGGSTIDISVKMAKRCIDNILKISKNESLPESDIVNAEYLANPKIKI